MSIAGVIAAVVRQEAPYQAEIQMGAQLLLDFQGARSGRRPYYWYRGTRYADWRKIPGIAYTCNSTNIGENADGSLVKATPNELCLTDQGVSLWEARQNKVTIFNANPVDLTGLVLAAGSDPAAVLSVVDDAAALSAAGLAGVATTGKVYKLDNSLGVAIATVNPSGVGAISNNTNPQTSSAYVRGGSGQIGGPNSGLRTPFGASSGYVRRIGTWTPANTSDRLGLTATAGQVLYFILLDYQEGAYPTPVIETRGASETRALPALTINGQAVLLGQFRSNFVYNSTMAGAVVGAPGTLPTGWAYGSSTGLAVAVAGLGTDGSGNPSIDLRFSGTVTTAGNLDLRLGGVASTPNTAVGAQWTAAATLALIGGAAPAGNAYLNVWEATASANYLANAAALAPTTAAPSRVSISRTFSNAGAAKAALVLQLPGLTVGQVVDVTYRLSAPQLEPGLVANAFIPTSGDPVVLGSPFSLFASVVLGAADGISRTLIQVDDGTAANRVGLQRDTANGASVYLSPAGSGVVALKANVTGTRALKIGTSVRGLTVVGSADGLGDVTGSYTPPALTTIRLGVTSTGSSPLNGYLKVAGVFGDLDSAQRMRLAA